MISRGLMHSADKNFAERRSEHRSEYRIVRPGGEIRWIEERAFISYDGDGRPQRMVGVNIDVTERKRSEEHQRPAGRGTRPSGQERACHCCRGCKRHERAQRSGSTSIDAFDRRIQSMADAHALLSRSHWQGVSLADLVRQELAPYAHR